MCRKNTRPVTRGGDPQPVSQGLGPQGLQGWLFFLCFGWEVPVGQGSSKQACLPLTYPHLCEAN